MLDIRAFRYRNKLSLTDLFNTVNLDPAVHSDLLRLLARFGVDIEYTRRLLKQRNNRSSQLTHEERLEIRRRSAAMTPSVVAKDEHRAMIVDFLNNDNLQWWNAARKDLNWWQLVEHYTTPSNI